MGYFNRFENRMSGFNMPKLSLYLSAMFLLGLLIMMINPNFYYLYLSLDIYKVLHGQIWRILTFLIYPIAYDRFILLSLLLIYFYYTFSRELNIAFGDFKYAMFLLIGILGHLIGGIIVYYITKSTVIILPTYFTFSIFIAYALTFPDSVFLLYFIIPIKAKYLAIFEIILYILIFISSSLTSRIEIICSLLNVIIFMYIMYKDKLYYFIRRIFKGFR